jgi:hypothetical protein
MTLWDMFSLVRFICNKDFDGNIVTPERFAELIKVVNIDHFRDKYGIPEEYRPGRPIATEFADISLKNIDDLKAFKKLLVNTTVTNGILPFPIDYGHRQSISYNYTKTINNIVTILPRIVEILREEEFTSREGNYTKRPTLQNPIAVIRNDGVHIRPITITSVTFSYYRFPVSPIFSYTIGDGFITYNAATSTELEWPEDEKVVIMRRCLEYIGINLKDGDIVTYANTKLKEG